ncbi:MULTISPECIES: type I restriction enzyme HsdR N-terminal domain-containing protein [unclassified Flavobacterium]|jgi:hypothetical protein|uniref:type I restriction enzyme HsdR N-terminal domain-containing protein n=1 Tax=unclassified Flavobacterium TaxID=196869 RepID=UPI0025C16F6C|nr:MULTISPECIES: type I restriction enzyme HsdR N-terminal domain-containing protein [unclassified Flavobacterium]
MTKISIKEIADKLANEVISNGKSKQLKVKTLLGHFSYKKRTENSAIKITELLAERNVLLSPSIMKFGDTWNLKLDDRVYLLERAKEIIEVKNKNEEFEVYDYQSDSWFEEIQTKQFLTEKEVENKFIIPLLKRLGFDDDDRYDGMPVKASIGSKKTVLEIDFALFNSKNITLVNQSLLIVEAKKEGRLQKITELENSQNQVKSYAFWASCSFGFLTDSKIIQVIGVSHLNTGMDVIFNCYREELKDKFLELYKLASKDSLSKFYEKLIK